MECSQAFEDQRVPDGNPVAIKINSARHGATAASPGFRNETQRGGQMRGRREPVGGKRQAQQAQSEESDQSDQAEDHDRRCLGEG
jgi:hypothetical protein